jgi:hypothetical protein
LKKTLIILFATVLIITDIVYFYLQFYYAANVAQQRNFQKQIGTYALDIKKTILGDYDKDSSYYKNLRIFFKDDSSFSLNMKVPFIYDSIGKWNAAGAGLEDWNWLYYKSWDYSKYEKNTGDQFTQPWTNDSIFYMNGATPQLERKGIQRIYFRKLSSGIVN